MPASLRPIENPSSVCRMVIVTLRRPSNARIFSATPSSSGMSARGSREAGAAFGDWLQRMQVDELAELFDQAIEIEDLIELVFTNRRDLGRIRLLLLFLGYRLAKQP